MLLSCSKSCSLTLNKVQTSSHDLKNDMNTTLTFDPYITSSISPLASCSPATVASLISLDTSNTFPLGALLHLLFLLSGHTLPLDSHMLPSHFCSNVTHSENPSLTSHLIINLKHSVSPYQAFFFFVAITTADPAFCRNCKFAYNMSVPVIK